jgi:hypothetical protein
VDRNDLSDAERIARAKRRFRESIFVSLIYGLVAAGLTAFYVYADLNGYLLRFGISSSQVGTIYFWTMIILTSVFLIFAMIRYWTPKIERQAEFLRKDMDNIHQRWRFLTLILSAVAVLNTIIFIGETHRGGSVAPWVTGIMFVMLAVLVCFGPGCISKNYREALNDELMRSHRARAARFGYLLLMPGLLGLVAVLQWRPQAGLPVAICLLCAGAVLPSLYFVILDWISTRGETP